MKKVVLALFVAALGFSSCKKCVECTYEVTGVKVTSGEVCGRRSEIEDIKEKYNAAAKADGVTASCFEK